MPDGLKSIGESAFHGCSSLEDVSIPESVTEIGKSAFCWCENLKHINLPSGLKSLSNSVFDDCSNLRYINLPDGLKSIGESAFHYCVSLEDVLIPESVTEIGECAFADCYSLKEIKLPDDLESIDRDCFANCTSLKEIELPYKIDYIPGDCFYEDENLEVIKITCPKFKTICSRSLYGCTNLKNIIFKDTNSFNESHLILSLSQNIRINEFSTVTIKGEEFIEVQIVKDGNTLIYDKENYSLRDKDGNIIDNPVIEQSESYELVNKSNIKDSTNNEYLYTLDKNNNTATLNKYLGNEESIEIPSEIYDSGQKYRVSEIARDIFKNNNNIKIITIPEVIEKIDENIFSNCNNISNIRLLNRTDTDVININLDNYYRVDLVGNEYNELQLVKKNNSNLVFDNDEYYLYDNNLNQVIDMSIYSDKKYRVFENLNKNFEYNEKDSYVTITKYIGNKSYVKIPKEVIINNKKCTVRKIGDNAFYGCLNIFKLECTNAIKEIGENAFYGCTLLREILIPGACDINSGAFENCFSLSKIDLGHVGTMNGAFRRCISLEELVIPSSMYTMYGAFYACLTLKKVSLSAGNMIWKGYIDETCFGSCNALTNVTIRDIDSVPENTSFKYYLVGAFYWGSADSYELEPIRLTGDVREVQFIRRWSDFIYDKEKYFLYKEYGDKIINNPKEIDEDGLITVRLENKNNNYDVNNDGKIDVLDLAYESESYNKCKDSEGWDGRLDFNSDGICDIYDIVRISKYL